MRASAPHAWGWHRLDSRWAERIVEAAQIRPGELVLDIGAGHGALTVPLLRAGARVIAVEQHPSRVARLQERFAHDPVTVVCADAAELRLPRRPFRVVANPPFAISSALLRALLSRGSRMTAADLVLQRAVVDKWTSPAAPGAGRWQRGYRSERGLRLPRRAFTPQPRVDAAVLVIRRSIGSAGG